MHVHNRSFSDQHGILFQVYRYLEPLYNDLRKVRQLRSDGGFELTHLDRISEDMLYKDYLFDIALPRLPKRNELEELVLPYHLLAS